MNDDLYKSLYDPYGLRSQFDSLYKSCPGFSWWEEQQRLGQLLRINSGLNQFNAPFDPSRIYDPSKPGPSGNF